MYFPGRGCVRTLRNLYVYATAAGPQLWSSLQVELREHNTSLGQFRRLLKMFLFR